MNINRTRTDNWFYYISTASITLINVKTSNNQRLGSTGNNDSRSKRFCSNAVLCSDRWQMVKACMIKVHSRHSIHSQWSPNECWLHSRDACVITTWGLGLRTDFLTPGIIRAFKRCEEIKLVMLVIGISSSTLAVSVTTPALYAWFVIMQMAMVKSPYFTSVVGNTCAVIFWLTNLALA